MAASARKSFEVLSPIGESDLDWIAEVLDVIERSVGQPWRFANDMLDTMPITRRRMQAVRSALARVLGAPKHLAPLAKRTRELVLGAPALGTEARDARLQLASAELGVDASEIPELLFCDLKGERGISMPSGRPSELEIAAFANIVLLQKAMKWAHRVTIRSWEDDGSLYRAASARGLLISASRESAAGEMEVTCATVLAIVGPLGLFQHTAVYGKLLGELMPLLAGSQRFELEIETLRATIRAASPILLPRSPIDRRATRQPAKLARQLEAIARDRREAITVTVGPPPLYGESAIACPDLALEHEGQTWHIELVGFWTDSYLERKLETYAELGARHVLLCVDAGKAATAGPFELSQLPPGHIVQYSRTIHADAIYAQVVR